MNRSLIRVFLLLAVLGQVTLFFSFIAIRYENTRYSLFWHGEEAEWKAALERENSNILYLSQLREPNQKDVLLAQKQRQLSAARAEFEKILATAYKPGADPKTQEVKKDLCIGVLSVDRTPQHYVLETVASVIRGLDPEIANRVVLFVLNAEATPAMHRDASNLSDLVPVVHRTQIPHLYPGSMAETDWKAKETLDYVFALRICHPISKYTLLLEDDLIVSSHFVQKLFERALTPLEAAVAVTERTGELGPTGLGKPWLFIRLFYSEYYSGWSSEDKVFLPLLSLSIGCLFTLLITSVLATIDTKSLRGYAVHHRKSTLLLWLLVSFSCGLVLFAVGKQNIFTSFPRGLYSFEPEAFAVGVVYENSKAPPLMAHMVDNYQGEPVDILLDQYARRHKLERLLLVPNLVQHIGAFSSNRMKNQGFSQLKMSQTFEE